MDQDIYGFFKKTGSQNEIVQSILKRHDLMHEGNENIDLTPYQPDHTGAPFRDPYNELNNRETWHQRLWSTIKASGLFGITVAICFMAKRFLG